MPEPLGVGIVGCGGAAQAIHLPAIASLPDLFRVVHCTDADADLAATVASRVRARPTGTLTELLEDDDVGVVCVCTPNHLHARQLAAACRAGKRGVVVEKPFATTSAEARAVADVAKEHGTKVLVDTMHLYDPAWTAARDAWGDLPRKTLIARATTFVGGNDAWIAAQTQAATASFAMDIDGFFTNLATQLSIVGPDAPRKAAALHQWLLGLAVHDLPLIRDAFGSVDAVEHARLVDARSYDIVLRAGATAIHLTAVWLDAPRIDWSFELVAPDAQWRVEFPPSFVSSAPGRAVRHDATGSHELPLRYETGYRQAWRDMYRAVKEGTDPVASPDGAVADLELVERIVRVAAGLPEDAPQKDGPPVVCIGAGVWSGVHLGLASFASPIVRVASRTIASAEARAWPFGADPATLADANLLDGAGAAIVVGVPATHASHAIAALEAGIPVLVEKPMTRTVREARAVAEAARRTGTRCVYAENWVYAPAFRAALDAIGAVREVTVKALWMRPMWGAFLDADYGGGALFDMGPHPIELARVLLGRPRAEWVEAELVKADDLDADIEARLAIGFEGGRSALVEVTWTGGLQAWAEGEDFRLEISPGYALTREGRTIPLPEARGAGQQLVQSGYGAESDALFGRGPVYADAEDGLAVMEIIAAAYRSAGAREPLPFTGNLDASPYELFSATDARPVRP